MSPRMRPEAFGAIVSSEDPPLLAQVDRALAARLGMEPSPLWTGPQPEQPPRVAPQLSAPTEVHVLLEGRCPAQCRHCYVSAGPKGALGPGSAEAKTTLRALAELGVFHVALGGGESSMREDLIELAHFARGLGLVPNLTVSGVGFDASAAEAYKVFGQVNVSVDGMGKRHREVRGDTSFRRAEATLRALLNAGVRGGINHVLTRPAWPELEMLVAWAHELGAVEVEILRLKPVGRAKGAVYEELRLSDEMHIALFPEVLRLAKRYPMHLKLDCSFGPMIFTHDPDPGVIAAFNVLGCDGGNSLGAIMPDGALTGCSFVPEGEPGAGLLADTNWEHDPSRRRFRQWTAQASAPCDTCPWLLTCQGGCHAVSQGTGGHFKDPDPECPRVIAHRHSGGALQKG